MNMTLKNHSCRGLTKGINRHFSTGDGVRNINNTYRYPDDIVGEVHYDSRIISGAMWDLREILGAELTDELVLRSMKLEPRDFQEYLEDILIVDDDNADLSDGTPHINAIFKAFYVNHGIDSEYFYLVAPEVSGEYLPSCSFTNNDTTTIAASVTDVIDVDPSSISMTVNGEPVALTNAKISNGYRVEHIPTIRGRGSCGLFKCLGYRKKLRLTQLVIFRGCKTSSLKYS